MTLDNSLSQLGEANRIDFHEDLYPSVRGVVNIAIFMELSVKDDSSGTTVILVFVIDENRLPNKRKVALLDFFGWEGVVVVIGPARNGSGPNVEIAGAHSDLGEVRLVCRASQRLRRKGRRQRFQCGVLANHRLSLAARLHYLGVVP